jgi:hypothetical protein
VVSAITADDEDSRNIKTKNKHKPKYNITVNKIMKGLYEKANIREGFDRQVPHKDGQRHHHNFRLQKVIADGRHRQY